MTVIGLIVMLVVVLVCLWLVNKYLPMPISMICNVVIVLATVLLLLNAVGLFDNGFFTHPVFARRR
jgi:hypothetical protein